MKDWAAVVATGLALPGVEQGTAYGKPALKFRGKMLAATTAPDDDSFVLHVALDEKDVAIETDPATFWETSHYRGWSAVLVRYGTPATDRIAMLLARAWWDRATIAQRKAFGDRPRVRMLDCSDRDGSAIVMHNKERCRGPRTG